MAMPIELRDKIEDALRRIEADLSVSIVCEPMDVAWKEPGNKEIQVATLRYDGELREVEDAAQ